MKNKEPPQDLLDWMGLTNAPNWLGSRSFGRLVGTLLAVAVPVLFAGSLITAFVVLWHTVDQAMNGEGASINLGAGALIAALLGAPFLIWSTVLKHQTVRYQKEGHITDRITKAVEQLGAEKSVDRIGRPATIWTGTPSQMSVGSESRDKYLEEPRSRLMGSEWSQRYNEEADEVWEGRLYDIHTWPSEKTVIQWQGEEIALVKSEEIGNVGDWQVFTETVPNIEVRIGAILSLERIAQDSTRYDKGRDHVRVMEILCAYVKENSTAQPSSGLTKPDNKNHRKWVDDMAKPREDIAMVLRVIGRRSNEQREVEKAHVTFDGHYRLDLHGTNLRKMDLSGMNFDDARLRGSWFDGAMLKQASFKSANLLETSFIEASATGAQFERANLGADFSDAILDGAKFEFTETDNEDSLFKSENGRYACFAGAQLLNASFLFSGNPSKKRNWGIGADFNDASMRGCLFDGFNGFFEHVWPEQFHHGSKNEKGLAFRNCHLTESIVSRCTLDLCFGDGTVKLPDGSGPENPMWPSTWPKVILSDIEYESTLREWRLSRP
uniref:pentapeptide repeat-containing protein n=1 Tax=Roseovarius sp. BRH_c41 TaxID=1629709 RepID=UPI000AB5862D|nr:pentapeptide repeat-containing protein [Roseovarius sp. BRH_c41]